jgi:hypothetical protein
MAAMTAPSASDEPDLLSIIDHVGWHLVQVNLPLCFFSIRVRPLDPDGNLAVVRRSLDSLGFVGRLPDGSAGILYVGPDAAEEESRQRLCSRIVGGLRFCLMLHGSPPTARTIEIRTLQSTTHALECAEQLVALLLRTPARVHVVHRPPSTTEPPVRMARPKGRLPGTTKLTPCPV